MGARKLGNADLARFRAVLAHMRSEVAGDIGGLEADAFSTDGQRVSIDNPADIGSDSFAQEFSLELLARDEATLVEIDAAIERFEAGTFGQCEGCQTWIPKVRLNAMPYARYCIECQREAEQAG